MTTLKRSLLLLTAMTSAIVAGCSSDPVSTNDPVVDPNWPPVNAQPFAADLPGDAYLATTVQVGDTIYMLGGETSDSALSRVRAFDLKSGTWSDRPSMPTARYHLGAVAIGNSIYAIGGRGVKLDNAGNDRVMRTVERYDLATRTWTKLPPIPSEGYDGTHPNYFAAVDGVLYTLSTRRTDLTLKIYRSTDGSSWSEFTSTRVPGHEPALIGAEGTLYITGRSFTDSTKNYLLAFDPTTYTLSEKAPPTHNQRGYLNSLFQHDGTIYKLNGLNGSPKVIEAYSIATDTWSQIPVPYNFTNNSFFRPMATDRAAGEFYFYSTPHVTRGFFFNTSTKSFFVR